MKLFLSTLMVTLLPVLANAQTATPAPGAAAQPSMFEMMIPFLFIFVIFYFLIIRPQSKRQKEQQGFLTTLKRGDEVLTTGGILGKIDGLTDTFVTLEVDQGVKLRILRTQIVSPKPAPTA
ncbi:MAG: preprotein translocase subunit YajC, partial [Bdellovibrionota bacterium]